MHPKFRQRSILFNSATQQLGNIAMLWPSLRLDGKGASVQGWNVSYSPSWLLILDGQWVEEVEVEVEDVEKGDKNEARDSRQKEESEKLQTLQRRV